jgi:hypothetical protein
MRAYGGVDIQLHAFWTSAIGGVFSSTSQLVYLRGKRSRYPVNRRLGGIQSWFGCFGEERGS